MKAPRNLEAIFLAVTVMTTWAAYATAEVPVAVAPAKVQASTVTDANMPVVVIKAKRLTALEKASLN